MAGPMTIQRFPSGLLALLGMQSRGDTPHELAPEVRASFDMLPYLAFDRMESTQAADQNIAAGFIGQVTNTALGRPIVPSGEMWLVYSIAVFLNQAVPAGASMRIRPLLFRGSAVPTHFYPVGDAQTYGPGEFGTLGTVYQTPIIMLPQDSVGIGVELNTTVAAVSYRTQTTFLRLTV